MKIVCDVQIPNQKEFVSPKLEDFNNDNLTEANSNQATLRKQNEDIEQFSSSDSEESVDKNISYQSQSRFMKSKKLSKKVKKTRAKLQKQEKSNFTFLNSEDIKRNYFDVYLAKQKRFKSFLYTLWNVLTFGILSLINRWTKKNLEEKMVYSKIEELEKSTHIVFVDHNQQKKFIKIKKEKLLLKDKFELDTYTFVNDFTLFFWNFSCSQFQQVEDFQREQNFQTFLQENKNGLNTSVVQNMQETYGKNLIQIKQTSIFYHCMDILAEPIASFEIFFLVLLYGLKFNTYFGFLLILLSYQFLRILIEKILEEKKLAKKYYYDEKIMVIRKDNEGISKKLILDSSQLVPGDLIEITNNMIIPADVVLIYGSCVVQDNFKPDENVSNTKISIDKNFNGSINQIDENNLILSGNYVLYTISHINEGCFGLICRTGFATKKGFAIKKKLTKNTKNQVFEKDLYYYYGILVILVTSFSLLYFIYQKLYSESQKNTRELFQKIFQMFIILLKPAVPFAFFVSLSNAVKSLKLKNIITNDTNSLTEIGKSKTYFIDKDVFVQNKISNCGFLVARQNDSSNYRTFEKFSTNSKKLLKKIEKKPLIKRYVECMGLNNLVTKMGQEYYGSVEEVEMLKQSHFDLQYQYQEKGQIMRKMIMSDKKAKGFSESYETLRIFEFKKNCKEFSSVLVKNSENEHILYTKGEPLEIQNLCSKSTLSYNYTQTISKYSSKGYKCISLAYKQVDSNQISQSREELEKDLIFLGFYLKKIQIEENFPEIVHEIKEHNVDLLVTSNNSLYLAISAATKANIMIAEKPVLIARTIIQNQVETIVWEKIESKKEDFENSQLEPAQEFNISDDSFFLNNDCQIALTGKAFRLISTQYTEQQFQTILEKIKVIGNLRNKDTQFVLEIFKDNNKNAPLVYVDDGFGDDNIKNNVQVSISLNETEHAHVSSLYSKEFHLSKLLQIIKESRNAIHNKHICFTFIIFFTISQFIGLLLLTQKRTSFANIHIFFLDFVVLLGISYVQASVKGSFKKCLQNRSIFNKKFFSYAGTMSIYGGLALALVVWMLRKTKFYQTPQQLTKIKNYDANMNFFYDPFVVFITLIILNVAFTILNNSKYVFKRSFFTNFWFYFYNFTLTITFFSLLFVYQIFQGKIQLLFVNLFRIPQIFGFEYLLIFFTVIFIFGFYLVRYLEKRFVRDYVKNYNKKRKVRKYKVDLESVQDSLYSETSYAQSQLEKKSKRSRSSQQRLVKKKLPMKKDVLESCTKQSVSQLERKKRNTRRKKRRQRDSSCESDY